MENMIQFAESLGFKLYGFQKDLLESLEKNQYNAILGSRQIGLTTMLSIFVAYTLVNKKLTDRNIYFGIVCEKLASSHEFLVKIGYILDRTKISYSTNFEQLIVPNGGRVNLLKLSDLTTTDKKRLNIIHSLDMLIVDNYSYLSDRSTIFVDKVIQSMIVNDKTGDFPTWGKLILASTGGGNNIKKFSEFKDNPKYHFTKIDYEQFPGRDETWATSIIQLVGQDNFDKEYKLKF
jgi:AAA+ ATPase superfamily predicted ATPase